MSKTKRQSIGSELGAKRQKKRKKIKKKPKKPKKAIYKQMCMAYNEYAFRATKIFLGGYLLCMPMLKIVFSLPQGF